MESTLRELYSEDPSRKTIVYLPSVNSWITKGSGGKGDVLSSLNESLGECDSEISKDSPMRTTILQSGKTIETLDLVTVADGSNVG
jgi:hypothetical protein